jgi:hypothetical protein
MPSLDDGGCSTFEDLAAALTQLAPETADGNLPVPTNATQPTAPDTAIATGYAEDFLQRATTWRLYSGRGEDELRDSARQMIRWVMRNLRLDMSPPVIPWPSRSLVWTLLTNKFQGILSTSQRAKGVVRKAAEDFATLAILGADPTFTATFGDTTSLAEAWLGSPLLHMSFDDWMQCHLREPLPLRLQGCEATTRQRTGKSSDSAVATPTSFVFTIPDAEDRSTLAETLEELKTALTQLLPPTTADGNSPVPTNATTPPAPSFGPTAPQTQGPSTSNATRPESTTTSCRDTHVRRNKTPKNQNQDCEAAFRRVDDANLSADAVPTVAPIFAAPQASVTPPTAAIPAFFYFTGGKLAAAEVRVKAAAPTTAFPFDAPVVGYKGPSTVDVQRAGSAKPCCTKTYRLRKSRDQWLRGLPTALRLRFLTAYHRRRMRVLQGREQSQNRALLESTKAGCSETRTTKEIGKNFSSRIRA